MSLKDEIEKLIRAEQGKIETRDSKHEEYRQRRRGRFAPLRAIIQEITDCIEQQYIEAKIGEYEARIKIGNQPESSRSVDAQWHIQPDYDVRFGAASEESLFHEKPGFLVEETVYHMDDVSEKSMTFEDEKEVSDFLIRNITQRVAHYRHLAALNKQEDGNG